MKERVSLKSCKLRLFKIAVLFLVVIVNLISTPAKVFSLNEYLLDMYAQNDIMFYDPDAGGCSPGVGLLSGKNTEEKVWNYFVSANITGVSDNPAVIAGIMGNLKQESGLNPFSEAGIYARLDGTLKKKVEAAGLGQYWGSSNAPEDAVSQAIQIELDELTQENQRFLGVGGGWYEKIGFLKHLNEVENTPEGYSDLFVMSVEGAVTSAKISPYTGGNNHLEDAGARRIGTENFKSQPGGGEYYQEAEERREYARDYYDRLSGASAVSSATAQTASDSGTYTWENGWLVDGMPGLIKDDVLDYDNGNKNPDPNAGETIKTGYSTDDNKPHFIILHSTEGSSNGAGAYGTSRFFSHFIIDLKKKEAYQHIPLTNRAMGTVTSDGYSVQIEIVGFSTADRSNSNYYLQKFTDDEWDYLAVLLAAIAQETGIPLTSSVSWESGTRLSSPDDLKNVTGIIGHMHSPSGDTHVDPGNIWQYVEAAIGRNPDASKFAKDSKVCGGSGLKSGGMTLEEAKAFVEPYAKRADNKETGNFSFDGAFVNDSNCPDGTLNNCSAFTQWFLNRYTTMGPNGAIIHQGATAVSKYLKENPDLIDGGKVPRVYAIMSHGPEEGSVDGWSNHTGIILGIDTANNSIIIGEANCSQSGYYRPQARKEELDQYTNNPSPYGPTYAYTDKILKGF